MYIESRIDRLLLEALEQTTRPSLIILCGNAGDGKSMLIRRLRQQLPDIAIDIKWDATHTSEQTGTLADSVDDFFKAYRDASSESQTGNLSHAIIAINTGVLLAFFEGEKKAHYTKLRNIIYNAIGLPGSKQSSSADIPYRVIVVDLDSRDPFIGDHPLLFAMLDRFAINDSAKPSLFGPSPFADCECVIRQNLQLFQDDDFRSGMLFVLRRSALSGKHFTMRSLWDILARAALGGRTDWSGLDCPFNEDAPTWRFRVENALFSSEEAPLSRFANEDPAKATSPALDRMCWQISQRPYQSSELENQTYDRLNRPSLIGTHLLDLRPESTASERDDFVGMRQRSLFFALDQESRLKTFLISEWSAFDTFANWLTLYRDAVTNSSSVDGPAFVPLRQLIHTAINALFLRHDEYALVPDLETRRSYQLYRKVGDLNPKLHPPLAKTQDELATFEHLPGAVSSIPIELFIENTEQSLSFLLDLPLYEALERANTGYYLGLADVNAFSRFKRLGERLGNLISDSRSVLATNGTRELVATAGGLGVRITVK